MQGMHLYEYAVIRVLPRVEREEFINVGVIIFSKAKKYIGIKYHVNEDKLKCFACEVETDFIIQSLEAWSTICQGHHSGGHIATFDIAERFRWLTAVKSSCLQTSRPHSGFSADLDATLTQLFEELVL